MRQFKIPDAGIGEGLYQLFGIIIRTIIGNDQFQVGIRLVQHTMNAFHNQLGPVVCGEYDAYHVTKYGKEWENVAWATSFVLLPYWYSITCIHGTKHITRCFSWLHCWVILYI